MKETLADKINRGKKRRATVNPAVGVAVISGIVLGVALGCALHSVTENPAPADGAEKFCDVLKRIDSLLRARMAGPTGARTSSPHAGIATRVGQTIH